MDVKNVIAIKKEKKKAFKKAKRRYLQPWKGLSGAFVFLAVFSLLLSLLVGMFDNTIAIITGDKFWALENEDPNAIYYSGDYKTTAERLEAGAKVVYQTELEGATLLMNENDALPLKQGSAISLFSTSSVNVVYGGTGSANVDSSTCDNLKQAAEKSGFNVNETLWNFYESGEASEYVRVDGGMFSSKKTQTVEAPWSVYTDEVKSSFNQYGDAAVIVISRVGGEDDDLEFAEYNYLELDENEKDMLSNIKALKDQGVFKKLVVLINSSNALQMDFLKGNPYGIDSVMWIGGVGQSGLNAVCDLLAGVDAEGNQVSPSGSLVVTYCYDNYSSPAMVNFAPTIYGGWEESGLPDTADTYVIYQEGIYVGYRYYETRYEDTVMGKGNTVGYDYSADVAFPFGYGLSYTSFSYSGYEVVYNENDDVFEVTVIVTNTGEYFGKETVQIYGQSPYTEYDRTYGVEKSSVQLVGFGKTELLAPGESETLTITVERRSLASYDANNAKTYILEDGDYYLTAATDAHNAVNNILSAKCYDTTNGMDADGDVSLVYKYVNEKFDAETYSVSFNGTAITNQVADTDLNYYDGNDVTVTYLSRNDWNGTFPKEIISIQLTEQMIKDLDALVYNPDNYDTVDMPVMGADGDLNLFHMIGASFDDPRWEQILDQLTFDEMANMIGDAFHWTTAIESINAPGTRDENGPQGLTASLFKFGAKIDTVALTSEDVMAATYNRSLAYGNGRVVGNDCVDNGYAVLYGPGNNIHRTPYSGRNFEYYSEDGYLSGQMTEQEVGGIEALGAKVVMKHFALNDNENERVGISVWANEQSIREIYLEAFRPAFENSDTVGVMTSYSRWGTTWSGSDSGLISGILRGEWGSKGIVISDNCRNHMDAVSGVVAGSSAYDDMANGKTDDFYDYENDPVVVAAMREACHYNLYTIANSLGMNGVGENTTVKVTAPGFVTAIEAAKIVSIIGAIAFIAMYLYKRILFSKSEEYAQYKEFKKSLKK